MARTYTAADVGKIRYINPETGKPEIDPETGDWKRVDNPDAIAIAAEWTANELITEEAEADRTREEQALDNLMLTITGVDSRLTFEAVQALYYHNYYVEGSATAPTGAHPSLQTLLDAYSAYLLATTKVVAL